MERVELACHTCYSVMDGIGTADDWIGFLAEKRIPVLAVTDCGNAGSFADFNKIIEKDDLSYKIIMGADIKIYDDINKAADNEEYGRLSVLVKNNTGKKNLYKLLSYGMANGGSGEPVIPLSILLDNRQGLFIGGADSDKDYDFLDYIMICSKDVYYNPYDTDPDRVNDESRNNSKVYSLLAMADKYNIPAVAVSEPYYRTYREMLAHAILKQLPELEDYYYKSDEEMLELFDFLGMDKAYEIVVTNTVKIAERCANSTDFFKEYDYPYINSQDLMLENICTEALKVKIPEASDEIKKRLSWELNAIKNTKSAYMFIQVKELFERLQVEPYEIGQRGGICSSLVAYLCGITEINPVEAGISPYFFFGYDGNKIPDIDINVRKDLRDKAVKEFGNVSGVGAIAHAATPMFLNEKDVKKIVLDWIKIKNVELYQKIMEDVENSDYPFEYFESILKSTIKKFKCSLGGIMVIPEGKEISDYFPLVLAEKNGENIVAAGYDYYSIDSGVYKLDVLSHDTPEMLYRLHKLTGVHPGSIDREDKNIMKMFCFDDNAEPECKGIPEFRLDFALEALKKTEPEKFDDLVRLCCLVHGTNTWLDNADRLLEKGIIKISEALASRDDVADGLIKYGIDEETAYLIAGNVWTGKICRGRCNSWPKWINLMISKGVPWWFIQSCEKIVYMFPRAHAYIYMYNSWRLAWFKHYYRSEYDKVISDFKNN